MLPQIVKAESIRLIVIIILGWKIGLEMHQMHLDIEFPGCTAYRILSNESEYKRGNGSF